VNSAEPMRLSVRDPSSITLQVIWPSLRISPCFAETKLMGRRGIFMLAIACRASSSMMSSKVGMWSGVEELSVFLTGSSCKGRLRYAERLYVSYMNKCGG